MTTFRVLFDEIPDAFDVVPDNDNLEWEEEDPDLAVGAVHPFLYSQSPISLSLAVRREMSLEIEHADLSDDWDFALAVVERAMDAAETVLVELVGEEPMPFEELVEYCDDEWRAEAYDAALERLLRQIANSGTIGIPGPQRMSYLGERVVARLSNESVSDVLRSVQWIRGPHFAVENVSMRLVGSEVPARVGVLGPDLRSLVSDASFVLLEGGGELLVPVAALALIGADRVRWLDDGNFLFGPIPETDWGPLLESLESHRANAAFAGFN